MLIPVGLKDFATRFPERVFDVGIAEQHALTMAAGLAFAGLHPVVAVYATFLNRAFDQLLMDCALHRAGVTFVLDRAGHHRPRRRLAQRHVGHVDQRRSCRGCASPHRATASRSRAQLREAVDIADAPSVVRFPKGSVADPVVAVRTVGHASTSSPSPTTATSTCCSSASARWPPRRWPPPRSSTAEGVRVRVVDPRVGAAGQRRPRRPGRCGRAGRGRRGQRRRRWHRLAGRARPARGRPRHPAATSSASPRSSSTTARAARCSTGSGSRRMPSPAASAPGWAEAHAGPPGPVVGRAPTGAPRLWTTSMDVVRTLDDWCMAGGFT